MLHFFLLPNLMARTPKATLGRSALAACLALAFSAGAQAQNLLDMYQSAKRTDATYLSALAQAQADMAAADKAKALTRPGFQLNAGVNSTDNKVSNAQFHTGSESVGINGSMPLFNRANSKTVELAQKRRALAQLNVAEAEQDLMLRTSKAYFDVLAAVDTLKFVRMRKAAVAEQLAYAKRTFEVGTTTITDTREAQAAYDLVLAQEAAAEFDLRTKGSALEQLVGLSPAMPWSLANPFTPPALQPPGLMDWVAKSDEAALVQKARIGVEAAKLETDIARAGRLPTVTANAGYNLGRGTEGASANTTARQASIGVNLAVPLYSGGSVENGVREKLALEDKAQSDLQAAQRGVEQGTRAAWYGVQSLQAQMRAYETAQQSSLSLLEASRLGYEVGVRINKDVLDAQTGLFQTQRDLAKSRYDLITTQLQLKKAAGVLSMADLQQINGYLVPPKPPAPEKPAAVKAQEGKTTPTKGSPKRSNKKTVPAAASSSTQTGKQTVVVTPVVATPVVVAPGTTLRTTAAAQALPALTPTPAPAPTNKNAKGSVPTPAVLVPAIAR